MNVQPVDTFREYLTGLARARLGPRLRRRVDVADVVQDTLLEAHRARARFRGRNSKQQAVWLREILNGQIARAHRHHNCAKRRIDRERSLERSASRLAQWLTAEQSSPSGTVARAETVNRLIERLATIPADEQEVLVMHFFDDRSLEEVGRELGVSRQTVGRLVRRGLMSLRKGLGES